MNSSAPVYQSAELLYANTDFSKLNWLETQWAAWYLWIGNPIIATGLMSFLLHEVRGADFFSQDVGMLILVLAYTDCVFRSMRALDHHRRHPLLQKMEAATR